MRKEVLRVEHITYVEQGITMLQDFKLNVFEGEIMGMIPLNAFGLNSFLKVLQYNLPLYDGYIYYKGVMTDSWKDMKRVNNRITIIRDKTSLVDGQNVACNIFVLRPGFKQEFLSFKTFRKQLQPFLDDIGISISADLPVEKLSLFERVVVEMLRAVVANHKLIIFQELGTMLSEAELTRIHKIMRHYAEKGFSFLYISPHFEEILQVCSRAAIMRNGKIIKILHDNEMDAKTLQNCTKEYDSRVRKYIDCYKKRKATEIVFEARNICGEFMENLSFQVHKGECLVIQNFDNNIFQELLQIIRKENTSFKGEFLIREKKATLLEERKVAVIEELPTQTMLFYGMSYLDNLCFNLDHRVKVWKNRKIKKSIRREYGEILGEQVFDKSIGELTEMEKYELVYTRILLQKPDVVFCIQPFKGADMAHRIKIWEMQEQLLEKEIAVVILAVNMADALSLADRVIRIERNTTVKEYQRKDFTSLPMSIPWRHLYE